MLNIIEKQNFISQNNFYFIYDALLNFEKHVRKYDGNTETYLQKLISIISSFQDNIFLKNKFNVYY